MTEFIYRAVNENGTRALGKALAASLPETALVALNGPLGAGKTRLVQAVAEALGIDPSLVTSPTFVLIHEYASRVSLFHFDLYRIRDEDEFLTLGPEEYFTRPGWIFIEWAERVAEFLPRDRLNITITANQPTAREFLIQSHGSIHQQVITSLRENIGRWPTADALQR
ncbi:MAG TPA: tRNA (adenosine(37)-N6)-threonylcarbamoyltransferase complex ATPase subunit type 1 TsaE [Pirellulales bacterium]|jgi:tRNA threonylcarbamoyladenosine biosynthesis protein TsaE